MAENTTPQNKAPTYALYSRFIMHSGDWMFNSELVVRRQCGDVGRSDYLART